ncbi:MAG: tetratricopeptide repeat protein [Candidatus Obscuribacterales bacterium]|nr:tetratricopeptide repeat protein [Candidatus Obscuribacterales bacterium]
MNLQSLRMVILACSLVVCSMPAIADGSRNSVARGNMELYNRACRVGNKAIELAKRGDYVGAIKLDREAIAINPNDAAWHHNLGNDLEKLGKLDEAIEEQKRAIALEPNILPPWLAFGLEYEQQKKFKDAERCYRNCVLLAPKSYGALGCLGDILRKQRQFEEAMQWLLKAKASPGGIENLREIQKKIDQCSRKDASD